MRRAERFPLRGEVWWTDFPTGPPQKVRRPVIIVSPDGRNRHERSTTVLVVPLSTSVHTLGPAHLLLRAGETGLGMDCAAQADNVSVVLRSNLREPTGGQRTLSNPTICKLAELMRIAMGCPEPSATVSSSAGHQE